MRIPFLFSTAFFVSALQMAVVEPVYAQAEPDDILASLGEIVLTQEEIDAMFSRVPEEQRLAFIRDGAKVDQLIRSLLKRKRVAADAVAAGYDEDPLIAARMRLAAQKELADAWLLKIVADAPPADYEALAYENYIANPDVYRTEPVLDLSHILLGVEERSLDDALVLARFLEKQLREDPDLFDEYVQQYSDDPSKAENGGRYPQMRKGQMVRAFEKAAFAMENAGEISEPVETKFGYHIIRLNGRSGFELPEYEAVKAEAVARAERKYREDYLSRYLRQVLDQPVVVHEEAVEAMARRHFGDDLEKAPAPPE